MRAYMFATIVSAGVLAWPAIPAAAQLSTTSSPLRALLLQELRETHNHKNWFVSEKEAVAGLTAEQAAWNDGKNHGVGQLVAHLNYWNATNLAGLKHQPAPPKVDKNDDTFNFNPKDWDATLKAFDRTMSDWEEFVQSRDDATLEKIAPTVARIAQHNAYHIAEMITSRKKQGSWNPDLGVK